MNYYFKNRSRRIVHTFTPAVINVRGNIYPSMRDIYNRFQQGEDLSRFVSDTPFSGSVVKFEEFDEIYNRNRFFLNELKRISDLESKRKKDDEDAKRSDKDEEDVNDTDSK